MEGVGRNKKRLLGKKPKWWRGEWRGGIRRPAAMAQASCRPNIPYIMAYGQSPIMQMQYKCAEGNKDELGKWRNREIEWAESKKLKRQKKVGKLLIWPSERREWCEGFGQRVRERICKNGRETTTSIGDGKAEIAGCRK
jgi:hypothetical protein